MLKGLCKVEKAGNIAGFVGYNYDAFKQELSVEPWQAGLALAQVLISLVSWHPSHMLVTCTYTAFKWRQVLACQACSASLLLISSGLQSSSLHFGGLRRVSCIEIVRPNRVVIEAETRGCSQQAERGVDALQWVHVLALMGDNSDNVPGVPGVGAKGALSLIQESGSIEGVLENADKVSTLPFT